MNPLSSAPASAPSRNSRSSSIGSEAQFEHQEGEQQNGGRRAADEHPGVRPAPGRALDQGVDQQGQPGGGQREATEVDPARARRDVRQDTGGEQQPDGPDRHVDPEHAGPAEVLDHRAADHGAHREAERGDPGPRGDGAGPLALVGEDVPQQGETAGGEQGRPDALQHPGADQHPDRPREGGDGGARREQGETEPEHPGTAVAVAERATGQQEGGVDEAESPLSAAEADGASRLEVVGEVRDRFRALPVETFPNLVELAADLTEPDLDVRFEFCVERILDGLATLLPPERR